jgi:hypothetical protein
MPRATDASESARVRPGLPDVMRAAGALARRPACGVRIPLRAGAEEHPALRRELRLVADHAGRDAIDIGNVSAAETKRIAGAGLLLIGRVGVDRMRQDRERTQCGDGRAKTDHAKTDHTKTARESNDQSPVWRLVSRRDRIRKAALSGPGCGRMRKERTRCFTGFTDMSDARSRGSGSDHSGVAHSSGRSQQRTASGERHDMFWIDGHTQAGIGTVGWARTTDLLFHRQAL